MFTTDLKYSDTEIKSDMMKKCSMVYFRFRRPPTCTDEEEEGYGMTPHSSSEVNEDLILNSDLIDFRTHNKR